MKLRCPAVQCALIVLSACGTEGLDVLQRTEPTMVSDGGQIEPVARDGGQPDAGGRDAGSRDGGTRDAGPQTACDDGNTSTVVFTDVTNVHSIKMTGRGAEFAMLLEEVSPLDPLIRNPIVYRFGFDGPALSRVVVAEDNVDSLLGIQGDLVVGAGPNGTSAHTDYQIFTRALAGETTLLRLTRNLHGMGTTDTTVFTASSSEDLDNALRVEERVVFTATGYSAALHNRSLTTAEVNAVSIPDGEVADWIAGLQLLLGGNVIWTMHNLRRLGDDHVIRITGFDRRLQTVVATFDGPQCEVIRAVDAVVAADRIAVVADCSRETILWIADVADPTRPTVVSVTNRMPQISSSVTWDGEVFVVATWPIGDDAAIVRDFRPDGTPLGILARLPAETVLPREQNLVAMADGADRRIGLAYAAGEPLTASAKTVLYRFESCRQ